MLDYAVATIGYKSSQNIITAYMQAFQQTQKPKEFVVVVNPYAGNPQETELITAFVEGNPNITRYAIMSQNIGCAKAFNIGMKLCESPIIIALSDDCRVGINTYELMVKAFDDPKVGIVGVEVGECFQAEGKTYPTAKGFLLAYRKRMIDRIGGYDEIASPLADEVELGFRAWAMGWKTVIVNGVSWHHVHDISNHPYDTITYMGRRVSPKGENAFQHITEPLLKEKIGDHKAGILLDAIFNSDD